MAQSSGGELSMLPDGAVLRFRYEQGKYQGVEYRATVEAGRIKVRGETWSPSGAAREVDKLIRGDEGHENHNGWRKWEWNPGDGEWERISNLSES